MKHTKEIHVLYIITQLELGGAQKVCLTLFNELKKEKIHTMLIAGPNGPLATDALKQNPDVYLPSFLTQTRSEGIVHELHCFFGLIHLIRTLKKKYPGLIVHTHSTKAGILGRWASFFAGVKKRIHTVHGYAMHEHSPWLLWLAIYMCELITRWITTHMIYVSTHDSQQGRHLFLLPSHKTSIIRAAVDADTFIAARRTTFILEKGSPFIFGTVACFKPQKNLFDLLEAFHVVYQQNSPCRLEIIGDGTLRPQIEQWIAKHHLQHAITLHGWQQNVAAIMQRWHAFVLTSLWEGLPCAVVEARLMHLPVISYRTGGILDIIIHQKNGLLIAQKDIAGFAQAMQTIMRDNQLYASLSSYADDLLAFDHREMIAEHKKMYLHL